VGDGVVPLQGDHSCNIKATVSRERKKCNIAKEAARGPLRINIPLSFLKSVVAG
jgi:hypothetical protein